MKTPTDFNTIEGGCGGGCGCGGGANRHRVAGYDAFGYLAIMEIVGSEPDAGPLGIAFNDISLLAEEGAILPDEFELPLDEESDSGADSDEYADSEGDPQAGLNGLLEPKPAVPRDSTTMESQARRRA